MTKILLSILIALVFVFGAAGVTMAAAQQSQPGEALYPLRTWSTQILRQQEETQVQFGHTGKIIQTRSGIHEQEAFQKPQDTETLDPCNQSVTNMQCGFDQGFRADNANEHPYQDHNGTEHKNNGTDHGDGRTGHDNNGSDYENDGGEHDGHD